MTTVSIIVLGLLFLSLFCALLTFSLAHNAIVLILIFEAGRKLFTVGWGREWANESGESPLSPVLREAQVPFVRREECRTDEDDSGFIYPFDLCAGEVGKAACYGDSGKIG